MSVARPPEKNILYETKTYHFEIKSIDEDQGIVTGYLSVKDNVDYQEDRVKDGAYKKTIGDALERKSNKGKKFLWPILWMHDPEKPIGGFTDAREDKKGLLTSMQYDITTNDAGIPNNPQATMVFSGFKQGYIDELSMGYKAIKWNYVTEKIDGKSVSIRELTEVQIWEGSAVTMLFAANNEAQVTGVKSATGKTSWPLMDQGTAWDGGKAHKQIVAWATKPDGSIDHGKLESTHFWCDDSAPDNLSSYKLPFCYIVNGSPKAVPRGIMAVAGVLQGARGGAQLGGDTNAVKKKVATYYKKMGMTPPWKKQSDQELEAKGFDDHYLTHTIEHWAHNWHHITKSLYQAIMDAFMIGDQPKSDTKDALDGFCKAVLDWVKQGMDMDVSSHIDDLAQGQLDYQQALQQMIRSIDMETKKGAAISSATRDTLSTIANNMQSLADQHAKMIDYHTKAAAKHQKMVAAHQNMQGIATKAVNDLTGLWQNEAQGPAFAGTDTDTGKSNTENENETKASSRTPALDGNQPSNDTEEEYDLDDVELALLTLKTERLEQLASKGK